MSQKSIFCMMSMLRPKAGMVIGSQELMKRFSKSIQNKYPVPTMVLWQLYNKCNMKCFYCAINGTKYREDPEQVLPTAKAKLVIDELAKSKIEGIHITGGEPFLRTDLIEIMKHAQSHGMVLSLTSNMSMITEDVSKQLKNAGLDRIMVGIDSCSRETYSELKGSDSFDSVIENMKKAADIGIDIEASMAVTKKNEHEFEGFVDLCLKNNVKYAMIWFPIAADQKETAYILNPQERWNFYQKIYDLSKELFNQIALFCQPCDGRWLLTLRENAQKEKNPLEIFRFEAISNMTKGCYASTHISGLSLEGNVYPCGAAIGNAGQSCGNVLEDGYLNIWKNSEVMINTRTRKLTGKCGECEKNARCGGCRVNAFMMEGDYYASDKTCVFAADEPTKKDNLYIR